VTSDFTVYDAAHPIDASASAGFEAASTVRYTRTADFATSNGPLDITSTVERFATPSGAADAYKRDLPALDAADATPLSTGPLGDAAHADAVVRDTPGGQQAVQITVEWRVANLLNILIVRGRYGGARLADALTLAHRQTANESA